MAADAHCGVCYLIPEILRNLPGIPHSNEVTDQIEGVSVAILDEFASLRFLTEARNPVNVPDGPIIGALQADHETEAVGAEHSRCRRQ